MDIAILGYGTVGSGTVTVLDRNREIITEESGEMIRVKAILIIVMKRRNQNDAQE